MVPHPYCEVRTISQREDGLEPELFPSQFGPQIEGRTRVGVAETRVERILTIVQGPAVVSHARERNNAQVRVVAYRDRIPPMQVQPENAVVGSVPRGFSKRPEWIVVERLVVGSLPDFQVRLGSDSVPFLRVRVFMPFRRSTFDPRRSTPPRSLRTVAVQEGYVFARSGQAV